MIYVVLLLNMLFFFFVSFGPFDTDFGKYIVLNVIDVYILFRAI